MSAAAAVMLVMVMRHHFLCTEHLCVLISGENCTLRRRAKNTVISCGVCECTNYTQWRYQPVKQCLSVFTARLHQNSILLLCEWVYSSPSSSSTATPPPLQKCYFLVTGKLLTSSIQTDTWHWGHIKCNRLAFVLYHWPLREGCYFFPLSLFVAPHSLTHSYRDSEHKSSVEKLHNSGLSGVSWTIEKNTVAVSMSIDETLGLFWVSTVTLVTLRRERGGEREYTVSAYLFHVQCFTFCHWHLCTCDVVY